MTTHVRQFKGRKVTLSCSYQRTCFYKDFSSLLREYFLLFLTSSSHSLSLISNLFSSFCCREIGFMWKLFWISDLGNCAGLKLILKVIRLHFLAGIFLEITEWSPKCINWFIDYWKCNLCGTVGRWKDDEDEGLRWMREIKTFFFYAFFFSFIA